MAITLNGIQEKVRALEGKPRTTPIRISELDARINSLEQRGQYKIVTYPENTFEAKIPDECINWNWRVINIRIVPTREDLPNINLFQGGIEVGMFSSGSVRILTFTKEGNYIKIGCRETRGLQILFYK